MNVIVVPDASMIVIPLIEKNGHTYLSPSNFSRYDNMDICDGNFRFDNLINSYGSSELPSGIRGRLYLFSKVVSKADAAIVIGKRPKENYDRMYNALNDLILFGGNSCNNARSLEVKMVNDLKIPTLKLAFPTNREQLIALIEKTNNFLKTLGNSQKNFSDNLNVDLTVNKKKLPVIDVKEILEKLI